MQKSRDTDRFRILTACHGYAISLALVVLFSLLCFPFSSSAQQEFSLAPVSLRECIAVSLASSPDVIAAQERIEQARAAVTQAQSGFYPRLSVKETFVRSTYAPLVFSNQLAQGNLSGDFPVPFPEDFDPFSQFNDPGPLNNWNTQVLLQLPLFRGGHTYFGARAALAQLDAVELALTALHNNLAFSVSAAYFEILKGENSIIIAEQSVRQIRSHLDIAEARFDNEVALKSDVLRVTVRLAEAEEALEIARRKLERARSQLNLAMGRPVNTSLVLVGIGSWAEPRPETADTLEALMELAHRQRSEVAGMDRNIAALKNSVDATKAGYYPHINAFAHYDIDTEDFSDSGDSWTIGVGAELSIFDGFLTRSAVRAARARLREAEAQKRHLVLRIDMEIKDAYLAKSEAARRIEVLHDSVAEAEETVRIVSERYAEGLALVTELLDAEVALTNTRLHLLSARYGYLVAEAALDRAVGRIVEEGTVK